ncbi:helix-turn-helix transcriptional regulator [Actinomadura montaniterrae]|uniref:helix-turn-helix transcriptional regulator n=1 Tax=Actinomadura montaniterrae TaxID=1803903 RepID=UPI001CEF8388|nr:LuxR family transcriptional regulator [Actinomadura montaniterrae]
MVALVERDEQIQQLDSLLADCTARRGRVALLEGPIGTGRTALLRGLAERAERSGFRCLRASCSPAEQELPYGVAGQLLRDAPRSDGPDDPSGRLLERLAAADGPNGADPASPHAVRTHHKLVLALLGHAEREPLLITVDDLRYADVPSLHLLLHLVRRLASAPVLVVLADEPVPRPRHLTFLAELFRRPELHRLRVGPLSPAGTARAASGPSGAPPVPAADLHAISGGNPLLLDALAEDARVAGGPRAEGYGLAFLGCLHRGDPATPAVARALAVMGEDAGPAELWRLVSLKPEDGERALGALNAARLLDDGRYRHPVARDAVLDELAPAERAELHRRAARLLHDRGAAATRIARHLVHADHAQEPWAAAVLSEAAEHALLDGRAEEGARFLRLAHRGLSDEGERAAVRTRLAGAEWQTAPASAARHLAPLVTAALGGRLGLADGLALAGRLLWFGRGEEAVRVLDRLRADARAEGGGLRDAEVWLAYAHPPLARDRRTPVLAAERAFAVPVLGGDPQLHAAAILADALTRRRSHAVAGRAEQVLRDLPLHPRNPWTVEAALLAVQVLLRADRLDAAAAWCEAPSGEAASGEGRDGEAGGGGTQAAFFAAARAEVALRTGDLPSALREARDALARLSPKSWGVAIGYPLGTCVLAATRAGEHDEAARYLALSVPEAMFKSRHGLYYLYARGHHHLASGHAHAALADFLSCGELIRGWGLDTAGPVPWRTDAAEAWLRLGNRDQARRLVREQLARTDGRGPALRVLAAASPAGRRLPLLTEAVDLAEASGDRYEQARVLADLSRVHAAGNRRRARLLLRQALHVANMCGMRPLARELLSVQADLGGAEAMADGLEGIASLTDSERRVASLAVVGNTNREIAAKLYITPSTVEQHLTRIYRKLGIRRRKELPADLWAGLRKTG